MYARQYRQPIDGPNRVLRGFRSAVQRARRDQLAGLRTLPEPLGDLCAGFYEQRVRRASPKPLLGEYLPWMIGDLLAADRASTSRLTAAWLPLYLHVLAIDDWLDEESDIDRQTLPIVSTVLAERAFQAYLLIFGSDPRFWARFDGFFLRTGVAGAREMLLARHHIATITPSDLRATGEKIDLVKICYLAQALAMGHDPSDAHLAALDDFAVGVQLLDDIGDWEGDLAIGNFTPLLALAYARDNPSQFGKPREVLARLVASGALAQCLDEAVYRLGRAAAIASRSPRGRGAQFLRATVDALESVRGECDAVSRIIQEDREGDVDADLALLLQRDGRLTTAVDMLRDSIEIVAQSS